MGMHESGGIARLIHVLACAGMPVEITIYLLADHIRAEESCRGIKEMGQGKRQKRRKKMKKMLAAAVHGVQLLPALYCPSRLETAVGGN